MANAAPPGGTHKRALVFGSGSTAKTVGARLGRAGFAVEHATADRLPDPGTPGALDELRSLLKSFADKDRQQPCFVHPATHAWSLRPELPILASEAGILPLTPPAPVVALFSNRLNLIGTAEKLRIPNLVLSFDPLYSPRELERFMVQRKLSFPIVLKSVRPAGPFGSRTLHLSGGGEELESALSLWMEQLRRRSGELMVYPEKYLDDARQVTVPFARFSNGATHVFPFVDTSLQSRSHEIVQFCPAQGFDEEISIELRNWTIALAGECRFVGVGSFHFLVEGNRAFLIDGRCRLESGFQLWEKIDGSDAVSWQIAATRFAPEPPKKNVLPEWKHGTLLRILAEDPVLQLPQPGVVHEVSEKRTWEFPGARAELHLNYAPGEIVSASGGPVVAQLLAGGQDPSQASAVAIGVLNEMWISGSLQTNERFLGELLNHPFVREGMFHRSFVDEEFVPGIRPEAELLKIVGSLPLSHPEVQKQSAEQAQGRWAAGDQWVQADPASIPWKRGPELWAANGLHGVSGSVLPADGHELRASAYPILPMPAGKWQVRLGSWFLSARRIVRTGASPQVLALVAGRVHAILYREGSIVPAHEPFLIIESMGYLVPHASPRDLRVQRWNVKAEQQVTAGESLADISFAPVQ